MTKLKRMKDIVGVVTADEQGEEMTFRRLTEEISGSGQIYNSYFNEILDASSNPDTSWDEVDDYLCPLVDQILIDAIQKDETIYLELVAAIQAAYAKLKQELNPSEVEYNLDRTNEDFFRKFDALIHDIASGMVIKEFDDQPLGQYRIVVARDNENQTNREGS